MKKKGIYRILHTAEKTEFERTKGQLKAIEKSEGLSWSELEQKTKNRTQEQQTLFNERKSK